MQSTLRSLSLPFLSFLVLCALAGSARAEDLGGGVKASHGRVPRFVLDRWIPGQASRARFLDLPAAAFGFALVSDKKASATLPGLGTLHVDLARPTFMALPVASSGLNITLLPPALLGSTWYIQGLYVESTGGLNGLKLTDATRVDFFVPKVFVVNQRLSAKSISVIDHVKKTVMQRLAPSYGGYVTYSPDRTRAYVSEIGLSVGQQVVAYDLTKTPIRVLAKIPINRATRYGNAISPDGKRLYQTTNDAIAEIDSDPTSPTYHRVLRYIPTKIKGPNRNGVIFIGPLDVAVGFGGRRLFVAYGQNASWPGKAVVGMIDLTKTTTPETAIPVTIGGTFIGLATHQHIRASFDGNFVYLQDFGPLFVSGNPFAKGFTKGTVVSVIHTVLGREVAAIPTGNFNAGEVFPDRLGRNLWVATMDVARVPRLLRIDIDQRSATRFQKLTYYRVDNRTYTSGALLGVSSTPDGSTVYATTTDNFGGTTKAAPLCHVFDAIRNTFTNRIAVESLCSHVSVQQR